MGSIEKIKILYIKPGPVPPPTDPIEDEFRFISSKFQGDILLPVWGECKDRKEVRGAFTYHFNYSWHYPHVVRALLDIIFYLFKGLSLFYFSGSRYQVIITYGTNKTGLAGVILKYLTGAKLIVDLPGNPSQGLIGNFKELDAKTRLRQLVGNFLVRLVVGKADMVKLLYDEQLDDFPALKSRPRRVFFAMTPLSHVLPSSVDENYILFIGSPWYLKGVDVLINAFNSVKSEYPDINLKIVGHCDDRSYFEQLAEGDSRIEMLPGVPHDKAFELIAKSTLFVLPSRTEAMGKVLLEAMAFGKPVIGSNVDGIPSIVNHGVNGLLFEKGSHVDLADKIRMVLDDRELYARLSRNGIIFVREEMSNEKFLELFYEMVSSCIAS